MLIVHHLGISQSERIVWLCEELGLPYELKRYARDPKSGLAPPEYRALHPQGTAPIITDGAVVIAESNAIVDYILGRYGDGRLTVGPRQPEFADYVFWLHFANGSFVPSQMLVMFGRAIPDSDGRVGAIIGGRSDRAWQMAEERLAKASYFAGETFSAADIMMVFPLTTMRAFIPKSLDTFPNIRRYLKQIGERPAYLRAMKAGDPDFTPMLT